MSQTIVPFERKYQADIVAILEEHPDIFSTEDHKKLEHDLAWSFADHRSERDAPYALILLVDGTCIGLTIYIFEPQTEFYYKIEWMLVKKSEQGKGYGTKLMQAVFQAIRDHGGRYVYLETSDERHNEKAKHFYEHLGFKRAGVLPNYYAAPITGRKTPEDDLIYYKELQFF